MLGHAVWFIYYWNELYPMNFYLELCKNIIFSGKECLYSCPHADKFVHLPFSFRSLDLFFASRALHVVLQGEIRAVRSCVLWQIFERSQVCMISAVYICMSLRRISYILPCVSALFWPVSIARYVFKSPGIYLLLRDKIWRLLWTCCLLGFKIVTQGSSVIRTAYKYSG